MVDGGTTFDPNTTLSQHLAQPNTGTTASIFAYPISIHIYFTYFLPIMNVDSSNNSLPSTHPVLVSIPSLPTCYTHGENRITKHHKQRCTLIGRVGKLHTSIPVVVYTSNKNIVCRTLPVILEGTSIETATSSPETGVPVLPSIHPTLSSLVYRGHTSNVTAIAVSKSGAYIASGDEKGTYKVWAYDHVDHLCKYTMNSFLTGPIHDLDWDDESKRIVIVGERSLSDTMTGVNTKVVQWDTGVSIVHTTNTGMAIHLPRGRATAGSFKSTRPYRIVTAGMEDGKLAFHSGPPFTKVPVTTTTTTTTPMETAHKTGSTIHAVRYHPAGTYVVSVGSDKAICLYDGTSLELLYQRETAHEATIYDVAWSSSTSTNTTDMILTASGDGTCKLFTMVVSPASADAKPSVTLQETHVWNVAQYQCESDVTLRGGSITMEPFDMEKLAITTSRSTSSSFPVGGVQLGCTFLQNGTIPISVGYNGQMTQLLLQSTNTKEQSSTIGGCHLLATGHCAPIAASCCGSSMVVSSTNKSVMKMYTGDTDGVLCQWDVSIGSSSSSTTTKGGNSTMIHPVRRVVPMNNSDLLYVTHHGAISGTVILYPPQSSNKDNTIAMLLSVGWDDHLYISMNDQVKYSQAIGSQPTTISSGGTSVACIVTVKGLVLVVSKSDAATPVTVSPVIPIPYEAQTAVISSDDTMLYVGGKDCKIYIYRIDGNEINLQHTIVDGHYKPIYCLSISNDGTKLASGDDRDLCVWDISSPTAPTALVGRGKWCFHTQRITTIGWSMDDRILISGGADDSIYIWCIEKKMTRLHYNYTHRGGVVSIHCISSSKQCQFVSCGVDAVVNLWDVTTNIEKKFGLTF